MNPNSLLFSERKRESGRERERRVTKFSPGVVGWCDGADKLIWIIVGQGPIALAVGASGVCLDIFTLVYLFSFFSPFLGDRPI